MRLNSLFSIISLISLMNYPTFAREAPTMGMLYNTSEPSALSYNCHMLKNGKLHCKFTHTMVIKKAKPEGLAKELAEAKKQYAEEMKKPVLKNELERLRIFINILESKKSLTDIKKSLSSKFVHDHKDFFDDFLEMDKNEKEDLLTLLKHMLNFFENKTEENYLALTKFTYEKKCRTCFIKQSSRYEITFVHVLDALSENEAWVAESVPQGPCGIVDLSRFVPDKTDKDNKILMWKYIDKRAITNPNGEDLFLKCSQLSEKEYLYDWQKTSKIKRLHHLGCEYIEFWP